MNEKGRQTKLLAAIAVLAMVVCVFAVAMPSDNVDGTTEASIGADASSAIITYTIGDAEEVSVNAEDLTAFLTAVNDATDDVAITIEQSFTVTPASVPETEAALWFNNPNNVTITIDGGDNTITFAGDNKTSVIGFGYSGATYEVSDLTIDGAYASESIESKHGINIFGANVDLTDITIENCGAAGIVVNGGVTGEEAGASSTVSASGITTSNNAWGGINVDSANGAATFTLTGTNNIGEAWQIWSEDSKSITLPTSFTKYTWVRTGDTAGNGAIYLQNSSTNGDFALKNTDTLTIGAEQTLTVNGTIYNAGKIDITAGGAVNANGYVKANANATITETGFTNTGINGTAVSNASDISTAFSDDVDTVIFAGVVNSAVTVPTNSTLIVQPASGAESVIINSTVTLSGEGASVQIANLAASSFTANNGDAGSSVEFTGISGTNVTISYGSVVIGGTGLTGEVTVNAGATLEISDAQPVNVGSSGLTINLGEGSTLLFDQDTNIDGALTITRDEESNSGSATVSASSGVTLTVNAAVSLSGILNMTVNDLEGDGTGSITVPAGVTFSYASANGVTINNNGGTVKVLDGQGTENQISVSQSINGYQYLSADTTILSGVTLTIPARSTLDLNGYNLYIEGTLVIEGRGLVTSGAMVGGSYGNIVLRSTGSIQNSGTIGDSMEITVANGANGDDYSEKVSMKGVSGVSIQLVRTIDSDNQRVYNMAVSGDISPINGVQGPSLTLANVDINADMTIGSGIALDIVGDVTVSRDSTAGSTTFTMGGSSMDITDATFTLGYGTTAVVNGCVNGTISATTGTVGDNGGIAPDTTAASVGFSGTNNGTTDYLYVTGMTISVDRVTTVDPDDSTRSIVYQRMYVSGTLALQADRSKDSPSSEITLSGDVYVDGTLTAPSNVTIAGNYTLMVDGTGMVVSSQYDLTYNGARYEIETTVNNAPVSTYYYTTFAAAMEQIATAEDSIIYVNGTYTINGTYTVADGQEIQAEGDSITGIVIGSETTITVSAQGVIDDLAFYTIEGRVIVLTGNGYSPNATIGTGAGLHYIYSVYAVDEETLDTTYSGFKVALDNATPGQTVTVVGDATYDGNLVVPAGVTVVVQDTIDLSVTGNVTIEADGTMTLGAQSTLTVGTADRESTVNVAGELDATDGGSIVAAVSGADIADVDIYSIGSLVSFGAIAGDGITVNAAYYIEAGEYTYTSVANAIAYAEANALPGGIRVTGTFTETGAVESDGVNITVDNNANVTLGSVTLNNASIVSAALPSPNTNNGVRGVYTATISALNESGDAAVSSTVSVSRTCATITSTVTLNAEGVNQYAFTVDAFDGNMTVSAGNVEFTGATIEVDRTKVLTVADGATLVISGNNVTITDDQNQYLVNNGTIVFDEDSVVTITTATIGGTVTVSEDARATVSGTLTVTGELNIDENGSMTVNDTLLVGAVPEILGEAASGSVTGEVALGSHEEPDNDGFETVPAIVVVFNGGSVTAATFTDGATEAESTSYSINGIQYATVHSIGNTIDVIDDYVHDLKDLVTYDGLEDYQQDIVWYSGTTPVSTQGIGDYAEVSAEIRYNSVGVYISVGSHITLSIDNKIYNANGLQQLTIGTHTVSVVIDPGYSGDVTITFGGQTIANGGQFTITSDMIDALEAPVLSATGQLTQDQTVINVDGGNGGDSGMGLTDYLLIILVILIVIMAIMVAFRLMRS